MITPISEFERGFLRRTKEAREHRSFSQTQMAAILDMDQGRYKNYETIRVLPHEYIMKFCLVCGIELGWLFGVRLGISEDKKRIPSSGKRLDPSPPAPRQTR